MYMTRLVVLITYFGEYVYIIHVEKAVHLDVCIDI